MQDIKYKSKEKTTYHAWTRVEDPMYWIKCPHCKTTILMSSPTVVEKLKTWARQFVKRNK